ncbi:XK-related protein 4-like isoform X2 [Periplaneta americana]|uniref:XK-related protein 4-like isoform X2 n=1 Tax=Periplaneta americana TaxID=6978 RepID=UPI0037E93020
MADCVVVKFSNDTVRTRTEDLSHNVAEEGQTLPAGSVFSVYHIICLLLSITTFILDVGFDSWLAYFYYRQGDGAYFALTVTFLIFPAIITTAFSLRWYIIDGDEPTLPKPPLWKWVLRIIMLLLQLAPVLRYCDALAYGVQSITAGKAGNRLRQQKMYRRMLDEDSDAALLRLFHCFLHAAPQAILQLMILIFHVNQQDVSSIQAIQAWAVICSLISVAWSLTSYHRSVRYARDDKEKLEWQGAVMQFCWHLMSTVSRVLALSLLASLFPAWMGTVCLCHWCVMSAWLALGHQQTAVCASRCEEVLFSFVLGLAYILAFIAPRDGPTRYSYLAYYLVFFMENTGALVVWCVASSSAQNPVLYYGAVVAQVVAFILALAFMLLYYRYFHPSGTSATLSKSISITDPDMDLSKPGIRVR